MRVKARQCPFTKKLFLEKDIFKYCMHLHQLRMKKHTIRRNKRMITETDAQIVDFKKNATNLTSIIEFLNNNYRNLMKYYNLKFLTQEYNGFRPNDLIHLELSSSQVTKNYYQEYVVSGRVNITVNKRLLDRSYLVPELLRLLGIEIRSSYRSTAESENFEFLIKTEYWSGMTQIICMNKLSNAPLSNGICN